MGPSPVYPSDPLERSPTERGTCRQKRGIFGPVGRVAHSLSEMLDSDSEAICNQKIAQLEEEQ